MFIHPKLTTMNNNENFSNQELTISKLPENISSIINTIISNLWKGEYRNYYNKNITNTKEEKDNERMNLKIEQAIVTLITDFFIKHTKEENFRWIDPNDFKDMIEDYLNKEWYKQFLSPYKKIDPDNPIVIDNWPLHKHDRHSFLNNKISLATKFDYKKRLEHYINKWGNNFRFDDSEYSDNFFNQLKWEKIIIPNNTELYWTSNIQLFIKDANSLEFSDIGHSNFYTMDWGKVNENWKTIYGEDIEDIIRIYKDTIPNNILPDQLKKIQKIYLINHLSNILYRIVRNLKI